MRANQPISVKNRPTFRSGASNSNTNLVSPPLSDANGLGNGSKSGSNDGFSLGSKVFHSKVMLDQVSSIDDGLSYFSRVVARCNSSGGEQ